MTTALVEHLRLESARHLCNVRDAVLGHGRDAAVAAGANWLCDQLLQRISEKREKPQPKTEDTTFVDPATRKSTLAPVPRPGAKR